MSPSSRSPQWRAFGLVLSVGFMTMLDVSIVNVALPSIQRFLGAGASHVQWIVAGYSLTFGLSLVPGGRLGDVLGRRSVFLIGLGGFVLASALCGLAPTATFLVVMRIAQGVFSGIVNPQVLALIQELFQGTERARAFGYFGMTIGVSTAIGPLLGGVLVSALGPQLGWRSVFLINVPIGLVVIPLSWRFLPPDSRARRSLDLDALGLVLLGAGVLAAMWPFVSATGARGFGGAPWWLLAIAASLFGVLVAWERRYDARGRHAILPASLVRNRAFVMGTAFGCAYFAGFTSIFIVLTMYFQEGLGFPAWLAGLAQMPFAISSAYAAARSGRLITSHGRRMIVMGVSMVIAGLAGVAAAGAFAPPRLAPWIMAVFLVVAGLGSGITISPNNALTLAQVPGRESGTASGLLQTLQRLGASIGLAVITTVFFALAQAGDGRAREGAWGHALALALLCTIAMLALALVIGVGDARRGAAKRR